jgi:hypothetical protein
MKVTLGWKGQTLDATPFSYIPRGSGASITYQPVPATGIPSGAMAIVFLNDHRRSQMAVGCPASVRAAIATEDVGTHGTGMGYAIHLTTSVPAVVYDIYPFGGAISDVASATLLIPTEAWDTNYVAISAYPPGAPPDYPTLNDPMDVDIVAAADNTQVQILPTSNIAARGGVHAALQNVTSTYTLNAGQVLQFAQLGDLSGSPIQANHPVGLWGGHYCMNIPSDAESCDGAHQQIPPVRALGHEYLAVRYRNRQPTPGQAPMDESVPWRIMGVVNGTQLAYDPPQPGAPATLALGQVVEYTAPGPFQVKSQDPAHPFYIAGHMTGCGPIEQPECGDPETVNIVPPSQFLNSYLFFTDPTYSETNLVLVRGPISAGTGTFADLTLDCLAGPVTGWQPIGGSGFQYARVDLQIDHAPVGNCDNGFHAMRSTAPFGLTVWGWDSAVSYAYPAGMSVHPINNVVVPPVAQ